jgi:hypothetical protein
VVIGGEGMGYMVELSRIKKDGTNGMKIYFEKNWVDKKDFPFKMGDLVIVKITPTKIIIQKVDSRMLNKMVGGYSGKK